jgi:micrococcal nuclease
MKSQGYPLGISQTFWTHQELVKQSWCWWYRKYAPGDTVLEGLKKEAREAKKGLWAEPQPVPPWEWRNRR